MVLMEGVTLSLWIASFGQCFSSAPCNHRKALKNKELQDNLLSSDFESKISYTEFSGFGIGLRIDDRSFIFKDRVVKVQLLPAWPKSPSGQQLWSHKVIPTCSVYEVTFQRDNRSS